MKVLTISLFALMALAAISCKKDDSTSSTTGTTSTTSTTGSDELAVYKKIYGASSVTKDGDFVVIKSNGLPDHKSPYYQNTQWAAEKYEAYNGSGTFNQNPNNITQQNLTFRIPFTPQEATNKQATPGGPIGVAINGIPFFNQYAAMGAPLTNEIVSFDQYGGHPQQQGQYHYHLEPYYLTAQKGKAVLLGFLLDGFPVYGPMENNQTVTNADLDVYHGHSHATIEYPGGIYHYHITATDPYLNGNGFFGTPGTVTN
jgi:hypothetical protein